MNVLYPRLPFDKGRRTLSARQFGSCEPLDQNRGVKAVFDLVIQPTRSEGERRVD